MGRSFSRRDDARFTPVLLIVSRRIVLIVCAIMFLASGWIACRARNEVKNTETLPVLLLLCGGGGRLETVVIMYFSHVPSF